MGGMENEMGPTAAELAPPPVEPPEAEQWTADDMYGDTGDLYGTGTADDVYGDATAEDLYGDTEGLGEATADDVYGDTDGLGEATTEEVFGDQPVVDKAADPDTLNRDRWQDGTELGPPSAETLSVQMKNERRG